MNDKRVTIEDIARELGLSASTVSRAISGSGYVSAKARQRITSAARSMGYVPDMNARGLRRGRRSEIGLVVTSLADPFYAGLATGFEAVARQHGYHLALIIDQGDAQDEIAIANSLLAMGVAGVALTPVSADAVDLLIERGLAVVQLDRTVSGNASYIAGDNREGGLLATRYMISRGHKRIALMLDHDRWTTGTARIEGYRLAHAEAGLTVDESLIMRLSEDRDNIRAGVESFFAGKAPPATAIFAANSVISEVLYVYCLDHGIRVPEDMSIVAYDDLPWTAMVRPALTVISQHVDQLGGLAAELVVGLMEAKQTKAPVTTLIRPSLVERGSVQKQR